jgi:hypothetical protein
LNPAYWQQVSDLQSQLAYLAMLSGQLPEARRNIEAAAVLLDGLRAARPGDPELLMLAASVAMHQGDLMEYEGHARDGLRYFQQAKQWMAEYARIKPENRARGRLHLLSTLVASSLQVNERYDEALNVLREAEPTIDGLLALEPDNPRYIRQKMAAANYESQIYDNETGKALGKPMEAVAAGRRYLALAQRLADADSRNASARLSLGIAHFQLSYPLGKIDPKESLREAQTGVRIFDEDLARTPNDRLLRSRRARALRYLAYALDRNQRTAEARRAIQQTIDVQKDLLAATPSDVSEREQLEFSQKVLLGLSSR